MSEEAVTRGEVARGAALVALSRASSLIEAVAQPLFIWLYGLAAYGLYVVLWGAINLAENVVDLSLTAALQRIVPQEDEETAHAAVKAALIVTVVPAALIALAVSLAAPWVAGFVSAAPEDRPWLVAAIAPVRLGAAPVDLRRSLDLGRPRPPRLRAGDPPAPVLGAERPHPLRLRLLRARGRPPRPGRSPISPRSA